MAILFEHLFREHILLRGCRYYEDGHVGDLQRDGNQIWAQVHGSTDYSVQIVLNENGIEDLSCDCPYFQGGHNCKHLAAVLYALSEEGGAADGPAVYTDTGLALKLAEGLTRQELLDFLRRQLEADGHLRARFLSLHQDRGRLGIPLYLRQIDSVLNYYGGREKYIDYREVDDFRSEIEDLIQIVERLVDEENYASALAMTKRLVEGICSLVIDDDSGQMSWIMDELADRLARILDEGPDSLKGPAFDWLYPAVRDGKFSDYAVRFTDILLTYFTEEHQLRELLGWINGKLAGITPELFERRFPRPLYWLKQKLVILWNLGAVEEANQHIEDHLHLPEFRFFVAEEYMKSGDYEEAESLLLEGKKQLQDRWGIVEQYSEMLMEIYKRRGDRRSLRREARLRVLEHAPGSLDAYRDYRAIFTPEDWPAERDYIIFRLREKGVNIKRIYAEERLFAELLRALQEDFHPWELDNYEELLKDRYPNELRDLLVRRVVDMAARAGGRKHYVRIRSELWKIAGYPGGAAIVEELRRSWSKQYKNRWAMMEELGLDGR